MGAREARLGRFMAAIALAVAALALAAGAWSGAEAGGAEAAATSNGAPATVTLVTGDRVTLVPSATGRPEVIFHPAPGSKPAGFDVLRDGERVQVIPDGVASLVPDVLDPALFDVTALVEMGYDDAHSGDLPLIVRRAAGVRRIDEPTPLEHVRNLGSIRASAVELDKDEAADFGDDLAEIEGRRSAPAALGGVTRIWLDRRLRADALDPYLTQVKAPAAWVSGLDGAGVTVAVLDTVVDGEHPALTGRLASQANFTDGPTPADGHGHGTHVASLVAGTGAGSDGARQGIAPAADVLAGKVLGDDGVGQQSWAIAGIEWAVAQGADVVNLSFGGPPAETDDPLVQSLESLTAQSGALFVAAAGNRGGFGFNPFTIETPGSAPSALTVGAVTATDALALFSSEGPTLGSYRLKPDVTATRRFRSSMRTTASSTGCARTRTATPPRASRPGATWSSRASSRRRAAATGRRSRSPGRPGWRCAPTPST